MFRITISKIRGIGVLWTSPTYHALWFEWADGGQITPNNKLKILWIKPRFKYVKVKGAYIEHYEGMEE
jgi:hypothetical protein